jgi:hypothetical protein
VSGRGYVDASSISILSAIQNSTMDLPLDPILAIAALENGMGVQSVLEIGFPHGIMLGALNVVLLLIHAMVPSLVLSVEEGAIHIHWF